MASGVTKTYRSRDGRHFFAFSFVPRGSVVDVYCVDHPVLLGRDADARRTHLFSSGKLCFIDGKEPRSQYRAEELARQWAEYFLDYIRTGEVQR